MKRVILMLAVVLTGMSAARGQSLKAVEKPLPEALCAEAPMPPAMAAKFARIEAMKQKRTVRQNGSLPSVDSRVVNKFHKFVKAENGTYQLAYNPSDEYIIYMPQMRLMNTSHGREHVKGDGGKFNIKRDRISYAVLEGNKIRIVNNQHKYVDMTE